MCGIGDVIVFVFHCVGDFIVFVFRCAGDGTKFPPFLSVFFGVLVYFL